MANLYVKAVPPVDLNRNTDWFMYPGVWTTYKLILFFSWLLVLSLFGCSLGMAWTVVNLSHFLVGSRKVGIVGLGSIGLKVAQRLEAFGCIISYLSRKKKPVSYPFYPDVHELATRCDVLVICCALTDQTRHLINKEVLLTLGKEGIIINIARGAIINEMELVQCLEQGEIAGAGLDVFENEPNVPEELLSLDNVVLTRHVACYTEDSFRALYELVSGNLEAFFLNKPLLSPVLDD